MTTEMNDTVESTTTSTETVTEENAEPVVTEQQTPKTVSAEAYKKVMDDMHKYKKALRDIEANKKADEIKALREKQDWQKIAEIKAQEADEAREQKEKLTKAVITDKKMSAIREAAMKAGVLDTALEDVDLLNWNDVEVETTSTGRINVLGAEDAVKRLKTLKPHWFGKQAAKVNGRVPETKQNSDIVTPEKLNKLKKAYKDGSGDYSAYENAFKAYQAQSNEKI